MKNVNPLWESQHITDADVVEHYADLIPKDERNIDVDPSLIGNKELNRRIAKYTRDENFLAQLDVFRKQGFVGKEAELAANKHANDLHEVYEASIEKLYKERAAGNTTA